MFLNVITVRTWFKGYASLKNTSNHHESVRHIHLSGQLLRRPCRDARYNMGHQILQRSGYGELSRPHSKPTGRTGESDGLGHNLPSGQWGKWPLSKFCLSRVGLILFTLLHRPSTARFAWTTSLPSITNCRRFSPLYKARIQLMIRPPRIKDLLVVSQRLQRSRLAL